MPAEPLCWIDTEYDRAYASDGVSRFRAYLVSHAELFEPWRDAGADGITLDPVDFAIAAFACATGPVMAPGYVRWHGRVFHHRAGRCDHDGHLLLVVTLATPAPRAVPWSWRGWERQFDGTWWEPNDARPGASSPRAASRSPGPRRAGLSSAAISRGPPARPGPARRPR